MLLFVRTPMFAGCVCLLSACSAAVPPRAAGPAPCASSSAKHMAALAAEHEVLRDAGLDDTERVEMLRQLHDSLSLQPPDAQLQALEEHAHGGVAGAQVHAVRLRVLGQAEATRLEAARATAEAE